MDQAPTTGPVMPPDIPPEVDAERRRTVAELGQMGFTLPGSVVTRPVTCGRATCRCATDPYQRHGPYIQWSRTVKGRTVNKMLSPQPVSYTHLRAHETDSYLVCRLLLEKKKKKKTKNP